MKRDIPIHHRRAVMKRCWPWFFWRACELCDREFRREYGWRSICHYPGGAYEIATVCAACCPTEPEAYEALVMKRLNRPSP